MEAAIYRDREQHVECAYLNVDAAYSKEYIRGGAVDQIERRFEHVVVPPSSNPPFAFQRWMSSIRAAALALGVLAPMGDALCGEFHVTSHTNDTNVVVEGTARLDSDMITAWQVLTDYRSYTQFVPGLRSSRVLRRQGDKVTVEQRADVAFGIFHEQVDVTYEISEHAPVALDSRIVSGCDCALESSYTLIPSDSGVVLSFKSLLSTGTGIRAAFQRRVGERSIQDHFHALATEMESRSMLARTSTFPDAKSR